MTTPTIAEELESFRARLVNCKLDFTYEVDKYRCNVRNINSHIRRLEKLQAAQLDLFAKDKEFP
jgi:hypothetical protein